MMSRISGDLFGGFDPAGDFDADARSRRANRRRLLVFASVFFTLVVIGLVWDFSRPAVYEATARLDFPRAEATPPAPDAAGPQYALRDEAQYLTSRTLLAKVWDDLRDGSGVPPALAAGDAPATLQTMLNATEVAGTNIVAIRAEGGDPAFLRTFVDRLISRYRAGLDERFKGGSTNALADARDEAGKLDVAVADKRREVDAFRAKNNIVSLERDENQVLSEVKGTGAALNAASEKVAGAEAKLAALKDAQAAGKAVTRSRDNPTLAALEQRAAGLRADLRATARQFTEEYMAIDPRIRAERAQLAETDEQIAAVRKDSQTGALQEAQEEVASARGAAAALRQQLAANQNAVQGFTSHFNEYKALQEALTHLEQLRQKAADRLSVLDAGERGRKPKVEVLEPPSVPQSPIRPLYARDAALVVMAALVAALAAMGIVEFFNRPPARATTVVVPQAWATPVGFDGSPVALGAPRPVALPGIDERTTDRAPSPLLAAPLPRELDDVEVAALLAAADPEFRAVTALFLTGLTPGEVVSLRRGDVDRARGVVTVAGPDARSVALPADTLDWIAGEDEADAPLFVDSGGRPLSDATLRTALLYAAHDAGLDAADDVTPEALRHTYVAFLLRQGLRFADVARIVGPLPADRLAAYKRLAPGGTAVGLGDVERILPALRRGPA